GVIARTAAAINLDAPLSNSPMCAPGVRLCSHMHRVGRALAIASTWMIAASVASAQPPPSEETPVAPAPTITAAGRVIDQLGRPIRGAQVKVEGASDGVTTDADGRFTITAPPGASLVITSDRHAAA